MCGSKDSKLQKCMRDKGKWPLKFCTLKKNEGWLHTKCVLDCPNMRCISDTTAIHGPRWNCKSKNR